MATKTPKPEKPDLLPDGTAVEDAARAAEGRAVTRPGAAARFAEPAAVEPPPEEPA